MRAEAGDWLIVKSRDENHHERRAEILAVPAADGSPPYRVRWLDDGRETLVFPGPDADIVSAARMSEFERTEAERVNEVQNAIAAHHPRSVG